ncbi:hypothetical protein MON38_13550 [Hymenobacter sp. DH14]|uniref:Transmembrane protein n=1 Tax=Hymenobacter cyanobacteriorum TaxID=2926463 RepID=A0A9X1VFX7_9BACT|nr:hypothetical protein [Hymenobacter cyanobacteriorum]MCI1188449.1 hypothetical protein [Hymenobacter cyanobacteriorum]
MKYLVNPAWLIILLGLALTTMGWALKLDGHQQADACVWVGTGLVLLFGGFALWGLVRNLDTGLRGPLALIGASLLISLLAAAGMAPGIAFGLALVGGLLAAGGTAWLLVRLNRTLDCRAAHRQRKYPA